MKKLLLLSMAVLFMAQSVLCDMLPKESLVCFSEETFKQMSDAILKKNNKEYHYLLKNGCVITVKPFDVTILDTSVWNNSAKIRLYAPDGRAFIGWTFPGSFEID